MKKTKIISSLSILFVMASFTNCAPKIKHYHKDTTTLTLGYIVHAEKSEVDALAKESGAEVRVINENANIYEIKGLEKKDIESELGHAKGFEIEKNRMIYNPLIVERNKKVNEKLVTETEKGLGFTTPCKNNPFDSNEKLPENAPTVPVILNDATAENVFFTDIYGTRIVQLNAEVKLNGIAIAANPEEVLTSVWLVLAPDYSSIAVKPLSMTDELTFKADALGEYTAVLIVQDKNNVCNAGKFTFGATINAHHKVFDAPVPNKEFYDHFQQLNLMGITDAWKNTKGDGVTVAVIDSGVNYLNPFLSKNIAINSKEIPDNKIDDDQNGFTDDVIGWDFVNEDNMPFDDGGHGSHVAGLIAGTAFGVAPNAKILPVKIFNTSGGADLATMLMGFIYAVDQGVDVINFSGGGNMLRFKMIKAAIEYAKSKNVTVVVAAGNEKTDNDATPIFPGNLDSTNLIQVASTNSKNELSTYSNYGLKSVKFAAPGGDSQVGGALNSAAVWNPKGVLITAMEGTSMSSPLVAGVVASMISLDSTLKSKSAEIESILAKTLVPAKELTNKVKYPGVVSAGKATDLIKTAKKPIGKELDASPQIPLN